MTISRRQFVGGVAGAGWPEWWALVLEGARRGPGQRRPFGGKDRTLASGGTTWSWGWVSI